MRPEGTFDLQAVDNFGPVQPLGEIQHDHGGQVGRLRKPFGAGVRLDGANFRE